MNVGITDCARYENYERWFLDAPVKVYVIRLSYKLNNLDDVKQCQGIVLSGGEDVDPCRYRRADLRNRLELTDIDEKRDEFEWGVIDRALELKLPILGICRGESPLAAESSSEPFDRRRHAVIQCSPRWDADLRYSNSDEHQWTRESARCVYSS